jgi:hypothetical protein
MAPLGTNAQWPGAGRAPTPRPAGTGLYARTAQADHPIDPRHPPDAPQPARARNLADAAQRPVVREIERFQWCLAETEGFEPSIRLDSV